MGAQVLRFLAAAGHIGAGPDEDVETALKRSLLVALSLICIVAGLLWGLIYFVLGAPVAAAMPLAYSVLTAISTALFARFRRFGIYRALQLALILVLPLLMAVVLGGFANSSAVIIWSALCPLGALLFYEPRKAMPWLAAFVAVLLVLPLIPSPVAAPHLSPAVIDFFYVMNIGGVLGIVFALTAYFVGQKDAFQERAEQLLLSILPKEISDILKAEQRTIADHYEKVSVLFADIERFTPLSASMAPHQLVAMLDEVFLCFDELVEKYGLEKIKTIGDCYMVASGVPRARHDHAEALTRFALDMQAAIANRAFGGHRLGFRIGMNSGSVVASVIGRKKIIYDLWGDAVNTASRMETHGVGGRIQITNAMFNRINASFDCHPAGTIEVKGKGAMDVWHVMGEHAAVT